MDKIEIHGIVNDNGGLIPFDKDLLNSFLEENKGKRVFMSFICVEPNTVDDHIWHIMKVVVPAFKEGYKNAGHIITDEEALDAIIDSCPLFVKHEKEKYTIFDFEAYKPNTEMQPKRLEEAISFLHAYCLEEFGITVKTKQ